MPFPRKGILLAVILALAAAAPARAQILVHKSLNVEDGLVQSQVNAILEDSNGFVWFGTFGGVSRWDGTEFTNYQTQDGLAALDIRAIYETGDGAILFGTSDNGLSVLRDGRLTTFNTSSGLPGNSVRGFDLAADGSLRIVTNGGILVFADESMDTTTATVLLAGKSVSGIEKSRAGGFYACTFRDGLFRCVDGRVETIDPQRELPHNIIRAIHERPDGTLVISVYKNGLWLMKDGVFREYEHNDALGGHDVKAICPANDGSVYMATLGGGVAAYRDGEPPEFITTANGLPNDISWWVHEGASGVVYLGTWNGVGLYRPGRFVTWNAAAGLPEQITAAASETKDGKYYVGTMGGGLAEITGGTVTHVFNTENGLNHNHVWSLCTAHDGTLYIGTHAGVNLLNGGRLQSIYLEGGDPSGRVYDIHETRDGVVYFATYGGVLAYRDGKVAPLYHEPDNRRSSVYSVCEGRDGVMYFGTAGGVVVARGDTVEVPTSPSRLTAVRIWSVYEGADGTMYFGTNGAGLMIMRGGFGFDKPVEALDVSNGLSDNTVYSILDDGTGLLYLSTNRGINVVDFSGEDPSVRRMGYGDGLASEECNQGRSFLDSRGRIWFSTNRGVSCYDPARDRPNTVPPKVHFTRVLLYEEELPLSMFKGSGEFSHRDNYFKFEFVGTNPRAPGGVVYRYRLSRIDRDWVEAKQKKVQYTALSHGDYVFEVKARNAWGYWSEPAVLRFAITPPYWKTWWFIVFAVIGVGGVIWLLVLNRVRHLLAIERIRTRIAADLHDDIGSALTEISITSEVVGWKLPEDTRETVAGELNRIGTASRQVINSMSDIVWLVNPRRDSLHDLIARLGDTYNETLVQAGIALRIQNLESLKNVRLGMEQRQHIFLIFKEAINNAVKYSGCSEISLGVDAKVGSITMILRDNGDGFDPDSVTSGNGLANMRERARKSEAVLGIVSVPGNGTTISLRIR